MQPWTGLDGGASWRSVEGGLRGPRSPSTRSSRDRQLRRSYAYGAAALWLVGGVGYVVLEAVAAAAFRPEYSYAHNYISDLGRPAISTLAGLMNLGFYLQGTSFFCAAVLMVRAIRIASPGTFLTFAAANGLGNILVATFHSGATGTGGWLHGVGAVLAIVGGNAAILAGSAILRRAGAMCWYRAASVALGVTGLLSFVMLGIGSRMAERNVLPHGLWERGSVYPIIVWQSLTAVYLFSRTR